jgi:hypothetical protein
MKKMLKVLTIALILPIVFLPSSHAEEVGGFAVIDSNGLVHGVIVGSIDYFGKNDKTMGHEYMGCPPGCRIVQQSTSDKNGNVAGLQGPTVFYDDTRNVFKAYEAIPSTNTKIIDEVSSNSSLTQTEISVLYGKASEFGVQDFRNSTDIQFNLTEVFPEQNTSSEIISTTKQYTCSDNILMCSVQFSNSSTQIDQEKIIINERKTASELESILVAENKNKLISSINLILNMLGKWLIP